MKDYLKCSDTAVKLLLCHYAKAWYPYITPYDFSYVMLPDGSVSLWVDRDRLWSPNKPEDKPNWYSDPEGTKI